MIAAGDKLPGATLTQADGAQISVQDLLGKPFVLFFYPKASTPGCTTESIEFSEKLSQFKALGLNVIGGSADSAKRQASFIAKNNLTVDIVSDESTQWLASMGIWAEKKNYGKSYMGIIRTSLLVDADGTVRQLWSPVRVKGHVDAVLEAAKAHYG